MRLCEWCHKKGRFALRCKREVAYVYWRQPDPIGRPSNFAKARTISTDHQLMGPIGRSSSFAKARTISTRATAETTTNATRAFGSTRAFVTLTTLTLSILSLIRSPVFSTPESV